MIFYTKTAEEAVAALKTTDSGLTEAEVKRRLKQYGPNTIVVKGEPLWRKIVEPFASVMMGILALAAVISLWHEAYFDVLVIVAIMMISAVIYYVQRFSTEQILRTLRQRTNVAIEVLRGGQMQKRSVEQLVPGDVISVSEGGKVPADARLLRTSMLRVDESQLTGESLPINKNAGPLSGDKAIYEQVNMIFQGSFVVAGEALAVVVATGNMTEFGSLAQLSGQARERSPIEKKVDRLISTVVAVVAAFALVAFALSMYRGMELSEALRFVIALSVSAVPESMPVAISIILAFGMRRMAVKKALVRTMDSIETIGVVTTIATDKTGTLTRNRLSVQAVWHPGVDKHDLRRLMSAAINARAEKFHDPLDVAFDDYCDYSARSESVATFPFEQAQGASGNLWRHDSEYELVVKGAPERLLERAEMTSEERQAAYTQLSTYASEGYRVIALAHKSFDAPIKNLPLALKGKGLKFAGLVAVADELRPEAKAAIRTAQRAGIVVRMITGDHFDLNTCFLAGGNRCDGFRSRRVDETNHSNED